MAIVGRAKYTRARAKFRGDATRRFLRVASPRTFARARVYFARPTITIAKIRDYSQSTKFYTLVTNLHNQTKESINAIKGTMSPQVHAQVDKNHLNTVREFRRLLYRIRCKYKRISTDFEKLSIFHRK